LRLCLKGTAGEHRLGNRARDDILPETARRQRARDRGEPAAMAPNQCCKFADPRGEQRFDPLAQALRQDRRSSPGADSDDHLAAIDDSGKNEGREIRAIDDIDGNALATRARGDVMIEQIAGGRNNGHDVAQVGLEGVPDADFKLPLPLGRRQFLRNVGAA
jgi:hypothetical protein